MSIKTKLVGVQGCFIDETAEVSSTVELADRVSIGPFCNVYAGKIGKGTRLGAYVELGGGEIGELCRIQSHVRIPPHVKIGNMVFVGGGVHFTNDKYPRAWGEPGELETKIYDGVSIGENATICPGVTIGEGAMIGAGAVVTADVAPYWTVVGSPARGIRPTKDRGDVLRAIEAFRTQSR